jgi:flagellar biosynthesis anti-sigma factor FlgM
MKIENMTINSITQMEPPIKKSGTPAATEAVHTAKKPDDAFSVDLSSKTEQLPSTQSPDEISRDRVAAIRDQLAAGTYNISGKDVANKILGVLKG